MVKSVSRRRPMQKLMVQQLLGFLCFCMCMRQQHAVVSSFSLAPAVRRSRTTPLLQNRRRISPCTICMVDDGQSQEDPLQPSLSNDWEDDDNKKAASGKSNDRGLFAPIKKWFRSEDGKEDIIIYLSSLFIALLIRFTIIEPRYIPSLSMYPTFEVGDQLAVEKVTKRIKPFYRNEVVVFNPPKAFQDIVEGQFGDKAKAKEALIKRIIAVEGDKVEVKNGKLYVNGKMADEPFVSENAEYQFGPVVVPADNVLVLGDNRNHSLDGHIWGFLPKKNVIGRAVFVYWPPWRLGNEGMY